MSERPDPDEVPETPAAAAGEAPRPAPTDGQAAESAADAAVARPEARIAELEAQVADLTDRLLRAHAEMDNIRKRSERERQDTAKYAISKFAAAIIAVGDNFQRAVSAVPPGAADEDAALKGLLEGVIMTEREFLNVLERHGVKRMDPAGHPFNPHLHEAVMEQQNPDVPNGTVIQVFQTGYTIENRVLRPAMVVVAKGGPKPVEERPEATAHADGSAAGNQESGGNNGA